MKQILIWGFIAMFFVGGIASMAMAQTTGSGSGSASVGVAAPSQTVFPQFDNDHSNDEIVQLSNLRITTAPGNALPAVFTATTDFGTINCMKFGGNSISYPCPTIPVRLFSIRTTQETILLFRNRARATIGDFAMGDTINVYGFMDQNSGTIDALIMRDLSKPAQERFVQLSGVEVVTPRSSDALPATIGVSRKIGPCFDYGPRGTDTKQTIPCPMGVMGGTVTTNNLGVYYIIVTLTNQTAILDRSRGVLPLTQVEVGDIVNVYGVLKTDSTIDARILRDLTKPREPQKTLSITTDSSLTGTVGNYFSTEFKVSGGFPGNYKISTDGSDAIPGLRFSRFTPCPTGIPCKIAAYESQNSIFLYGTPQTSGTYTVVISAWDNPPIPMCAAKDPSLGVGMNCPVVQSNFGQAKFTIIINNGDTTGNHAPVITQIKGPTQLNVGMQGKWAISVSDIDHGDLSVLVDWGDGSGMGNVANVSGATLSPTGSGYVTPPPAEYMASFTHAYQALGTYTITFKVTDNTGLSSAASMSVNAVNKFISTIPPEPLPLPFPPPSEVH